MAAGSVIQSDTGNALDQLQFDLAVRDVRHDPTDGDPVDPFRMEGEKDD
jgi:hypothetical protein